MASIHHHTGRPTNPLRAPGFQALALVLASWVPVVAVFHVVT